ncbi:MAG TPA: phage tail protein [Herpetosiphonaceae bacterium]
MDYGLLSYLDQHGTPRKYTLRLGSMTIGRAPENEIVFEDEQIERFHIRVLCLPDGCWAINLGNGGTLLNQVTLQPNIRTLLRDGDTIYVGAYEVKYNAQQQLETLSPVLRPEIAAKLPQIVQPAPPPPKRSTVRRLRGNGGPPRVQRSLYLDDSVSSYLQYLPPCYQADDFLGRFLLIFEAINDPLERMIDQIPFYFDPRLTPESFLPWLASWVDLVLNENWTVEQRRALIRAAPDLYRWRGTRRGLSEYIKLYAGVKPIIVEPHETEQNGEQEPLPPHVFRVVLNVPDPDEIDRDIIEAIIESEKPAHTGYILEIHQATVAAS